MTTRFSHVDPSTEETSRSVTFISSGFSADDILDVDTSLGRPASYALIETDSDASITFSVNSVLRLYGIHRDYLKLNMPVRDLETEKLVNNTAAPSFTVSNGEMMELNIGIKDIRVTALTAGAGTGVTITLR